MRTQILVLAKQPVAGRVKTRLCPPCTPDQAAVLAAAAIEDTIDAVDRARADARTLVLDGHLRLRPHWMKVEQTGGPLDVRLEHAYRATALPGTASLLIGMDTPQVTGEALNAAWDALTDADAAFGPAADGGWWALALREPLDAQALLGIPTSRSDTGTRTLEALRSRGLRVAMLPELRDVDTASDAWEIASAHPGGRFAAAVREHLGAPAAAR